MDLFGEVPLRWRYIAIALISLFCSVAGLVWAVHNNCPEAAGRGGAISTMIALAVLFLRPDYGLWIYDQRMKAVPEDASADERLKEQVDSVVAALRIDSSGHTLQNVALVGASVIGTIVWGFGDVFARWLM